MTTKNNVDDEIKALAVTALVNAFYEDYSALVNAYLSAGKGLEDEQLLKMQLQEHSNVFSRADPEDADQEKAPNIYTGNSEGPGRFGWTPSTGWDNLLDALESDKAFALSLQGQTVFERRSGEWYYVGG